SFLRHPHYGAPLPRHTQPREVAELKGLTKHNPQRYRKVPAKSEFPLGEMPEHLSEGAKGVWFELETYSAAGVLTGGDRMLLALTAELVAEWREDPRAFPAARIGHLISCLGRLGLSPADRQKIGTEPVPEGNPFEKF